jgi:uncharacterized protein (DUF1330 family)
MVADHTMCDQDTMVAYVKLAIPAIEAAAGRFLVRGGQVTGREFGAGLPERAFIIEFESYERAVQAYESEAYKKALKVFEDAGIVRDVRIVEGLG